MLAWMMFFVIFVVVIERAGADAIGALGVPLSAEDGARTSSRLIMSEHRPSPCNAVSRTREPASSSSCRPDRTARWTVAVAPARAVAGLPATLSARLPHASWRRSRSSSHEFQHPVRVEARGAFCNNELVAEPGDQPRANRTGIALMLHHPHRRASRLRHGELVAGAGLLHRPGDRGAGASLPTSGLCSRVMWFGFGNKAPVFCAVVSATRRA